jgi:MerR family transcriptional regulator, repressor of the yfmOP operon
MSSGSSSYPIGDVAKRVGMTPRTIRYYEDIGLLNSVRRVEGGRRIYTDEDIRRLKFIERLKLLGLTLDEMKELEELYVNCRSNDRVLPHLLQLLDKHLDSIVSKMEQLKMLQRDIEAYRGHILQKI